VVGNLVSNAIRHSREGDTVTLHARREAGTVAIEVADRGDGIAAEHLPHVFDRFWRAEKSRTRRAGGSGLGLAIVRKVVEAHAGTVTVASAQGAGATFTVRLPT
jgi:two-component system sensor histidine kinase BaeS